MGLRGRTPKPTATVIAEGNPGKRKINRNEPDLGDGMPQCPDYLDEEAKRQWCQLAPILHRARLLKEGHYIALGNLCQAYSTMKKAQGMLDKSGLIIKTRSGYVQQSPLISIITTNMELVTKLSREFGLTPASSRSLAVTEEKEDELAKLLSTPREPRKIAIQ
jgi:P27 family predicted phage terminase small subunit